MTVEDGVRTHVFQDVVPPSPTGICSSSHASSRPFPSIEKKPKQKQVT